MLGAQGLVARARDRLYIAPRMRPEELARGDVIVGKYVVERLLGRGGMGAVYVVSHATTGKRMAMKCMLPGLVHDAELVGRFMREARVMGRVQHRHVVDVFDFGREGDLLFIVMELLEGKPLSELLGDDSVTLEDALTILLRAMEGVAAAHDHGVIHRDLKPDNIFVCEGASGRLDDPRVLDFGISKLEEPTGDALTRTGMALGTPYYMAFEQLSGQRDLDARADVYAMGVILYEAISGSPPHMGETPSAVAIRMLTTPPVDLATLRPELPPGLTAAIMQAISRAREDRPSSMRELIARLRSFVPPDAGPPLPTGSRVPLRTPRGAGTSASGAPESQDALEGAPAEQRQLSAERSPRSWRSLGLASAALVGLVVIGVATYSPRFDAVAPVVPRVPQRAGELAWPPPAPAADGDLAVMSDASLNGAHELDPTAAAPTRAPSVATRLDAPATREKAGVGHGTSRWMSPVRQKRAPASGSMPTEASRGRPSGSPLPAVPTPGGAAPVTPPAIIDAGKARGRAGTLGASEF